jgi:hypothetical protein
MANEKDGGIPCYPEPIEDDHCDIFKFSGVEVLRAAP